MPDEYLEYHQDRDAFVDSQSPADANERDILNGAYCVGANGESLTNYTFPEGLATQVTACADEGSATQGEKPRRPIPPPPPPPDLTGSL